MNSMESVAPSTVVLVSVLIIIAAIAFTCLLLRWIFKIKRQVWMQKQQINLLIKIAEKLGVSPDDDQLENIRKRNNSPHDEHLN